MKLFRFVSVMFALSLVVPAVSQIVGNSGIDKLSKAAAQNDPDGSLIRLNFQLENSEVLINSVAQSIAEGGVLQEDVLGQTQKSVGFLLSAQKQFVDVVIGELNQEQIHVVFEASDLPVLEWFQDGSSLLTWAKKEIDQCLILLEAWNQGEGDERDILIVQEKISLVQLVMARIQFREHEAG